MTFKGSCQCRSIQFEIESPVKWCAHCHCRKCQRAHGAAFVAWFGVDITQFELLRGRDELVWYASSKPARRGFCSKCGSTLFFKSERWEDEIHIVLANMEDNLDCQPSAHVFYDNHVDWLEPFGTLPKRGGATGVIPLTED